MCIYMLVDGREGDSSSIWVELLKRNARPEGDILKMGFLV